MANGMQKSRAQPTATSSWCFSYQAGITSGMMAMESNMPAKGMTLHSDRVKASMCGGPPNERND